MKVFITRASDGCWVPGGPILAFYGLGSRNQKSTKWVSGGPILALSGLGSRSRQNASQEVGFQHFLALAPEVDKMGPRRSDLSIS